MGLLKHSIKILLLSSCLFQQYLWGGSSVVNGDSSVSKNVVQNIYPVLLKLGSSSLPDFINKSLKLLEKVYPEMTSMISLAATSFLGGVQCEGADAKSPCFILLFKDQTEIRPVFFFKAIDGCPLVKNLSVGLDKVGSNALVHPLPFDGKLPVWWMYGERSFLDKISKNLSKIASFIYKDESVENALEGEIFMDEFDLSSMSMPLIGNLIYNTFIKTNFNRLKLVFDSIDNNIIYQMNLSVKPSSPAGIYLKSLASKEGVYRYLGWNSEEAVKTIAFEDYGALKVLLESCTNGMDENLWRADKVSYDFYQWWNIIMPLVNEILEFADKNLSGNSQVYADIHSDGSVFNTNSFSLLEGKVVEGGAVGDSLTSNLTNFLDSFVQKSLKQQFNLALEKKLPGCDWIPSLVFVLDKNILMHNGCFVQGVSLSVGEGPSRIQYPILLSVCKNYLLCADNLDDLKRLIDRVQEVKTFSYLNFSGFVKKTTVRLRDVLTIIGVKVDPQNYFEMTYSIDIPKNELCFKTKFPLCIDFKAFSEYSKSLLKQNTNEEKSKESTVNTKKDE